MKIVKWMIIPLAAVLVSGCAAPKIGLLSPEEVPLKEYALQGSQKEKVLVISVRGLLSNEPKFGWLRKKPSLVQEVVSQLRKAETDQQIGAVVLKVDSPGGSVTASDQLYHEIKSFKTRTGVKVVAAMEDVAASGGYYLSLPADHITAHPTSVTGSVGVIFFQPRFYGLMEKIGVAVDVNKSGANKDMGSPFRPATKEEERIIQDLTDRLAKKFSNLVAQHRNIDATTMAQITSGRVYLAEDALKLGMIDSIGYFDDAVNKAIELAGLPPNAKVVVYRRFENPNDNYYNAATSSAGEDTPSMINIDLLDNTAGLKTGFYYLWPLAVSD
jgi:protease-4